MSNHQYGHVFRHKGGEIVMTLGVDYFEGASSPLDQAVIVLKADDEMATDWPQGTVTSLAHVPEDLEELE